MRANWTFKDNSLPERSICYPLTPISINTIDAESLTSYIQRLSAAHSVSVLNLVKHLVVPTLYLEKNVEYSTDNLYKVFSRSSGINGYNQLSVDMLYAIKKLTKRSDLEKLTYSGISALLTHGSIQSSHQWCPVCFEEEKKDMVYEKLIWSLKSVTICLKHECYLESKCPSCNKEIKHLGFNSIIGYCSNCKSWLGKDKSKVKKVSEDLLDWQQWVYKNMEEMLKSKHNAMLNKDFILNRISSIISEDFSRCGNTQKQMAINMNIRRRTIYEWRTQKRQISFELFLVLSYCMEQSICSLLHQNEQINIHFTKKIGIDLKERYTRMNIAEKRQALNQIIESQEYPPPSLKNVIDRLGYKSSVPLKKYFPNEWDLIGKRYQEYRSQIKNEKIASVKKAIENCVYEALMKGKIPTKRYISNHTNIGGIIVSREIREYVEKILIEIPQQFNRENK